MSQTSIQRLSWFHYAFAALAAYLVLWVDGLLVGVYQMLHQGIIINRLHQDQDNSVGVVPFALVTVVIGAVNFLILWPFLRFRILRWIVYFCLCAGWIFILQFFQADTR